jgi:hypothetical protein
MMRIAVETSGKSIILKMHFHGWVRAWNGVLI